MIQSDVLQKWRPTVSHCCEFSFLPAKPLRKLARGGIINNIVNHALLLLSVSVLFTSGCIHFPKHGADIRPSAYRMKSGTYEILGEAEGQSSNFKLLWFFPVTDRLDLKEAIDEAIGEKGGDNLIEVYVWRQRQYWIVGTIEVLQVKGKVIRYTD